MLRPVVLRGETGDWERDCIGEDTGEQTGDVFPVLVPRVAPYCGGKYESRSCMGDSDVVVESMFAGGWWTPVVSRGSQSGCLDDGTGSDATGFVVVAVESWTKPGGRIDSGDALAPKAPCACSRRSLELSEAWREWREEGEEA